jgi:hypothetical protein
MQAAPMFRQRKGNETKIPITKSRLRLVKGLRDLPSNAQRDNNNNNKKNISESVLVAKNRNQGVVEQSKQEENAINR